MRVFDVYRQQDDPHQTIAIKRGFSWPAFLFGYIWAFVKRLWGFGFLILGVAAGLAFVEAVHEAGPARGDPAGLLLILAGRIAFAVWVGFVGNDRRRQWALEKGYVLVQSEVAASGPREAIERATGHVAPPAPGMAATAAP